MMTNPRHRDRGSVILIAVGILVMVAMVGMTFVLAAYMDRRVSTSIARSVPFKKAALGTLTLAQQKFIIDLHFNQTGNSDRPYEAATTWMQQVDGPFKAVDPWLASTVAEGLAGNKTFRRISDLFGEGTANYDNIPPVAMPDPNTPITVSGKTGWYVDTDANGEVDARLVDTGVRDGQGNRFYTAVRIIDTCSQINVNTAYGPQTVVPFDEPYTSGGTRGIPVTDMDFSGLAPLTGTTAADIHKKRSELPLPDTTPSIWAYWFFYARCAASQNAPSSEPLQQSYYPVFGLDDQLALSWREYQATRSTYTGRGRLAALLSGNGANNSSFFKLRPFLTTWNSSRVIPPRIPTIMAAGGVSLYEFPQPKRADLNPKLGTPAERAAAFFSLYMAAANSIPLGVPDLTDGAAAASDRWRRAAQMAVNIIDFADADEDVTVMDVPGLPGQKVFGIERQCFLTEAFYKVYKTSTGVVRTYSALELYNPYSTPVSLENLRVTENGNPRPTSGPANPVVPPGGRVVIVSARGINVDIPVRDGTLVISVPAGLDLTKGVKLYLSRKADGSSPPPERDVLLAAVTFLPLPVPLDNDSGVTLVRQWDDRPEKALYALGSVYKDYDTIDYTNADGGGSANSSTTKLGDLNDKAAEVAADPRNFGANPTPVYVRNGKFVSLGDLARIFHVGPGFDGKSLAGNLGDGASVAQGRLDATVPAASADPSKIPPISPACLASEFFTVINPAADGIDNDGDWLGGALVRVTVDPEEDVVFGMLNPNSAPREALLCLPYVTPAIADQIIIDRTARPFAASGEVLASIRKIGLGAGNNLYAPGPNYKIADGKTTDDGLPAQVNDDLTKLQAVYTRMANMITVRSDSFAVYITVMRFSSDDLSQPNGVRRYVALLDRSDCYKRGHWPKIKMFVEIR